MRTVVDNATLARLWAEQSQSHARSSSGSFSKTLLYSYGTVIAAITKTKNGDTVYLLNETQYSNSTSVLRNLAAAAIPDNAKVYHVPGIDYRLPGEFTNRLRIVKTLLVKWSGLLDESEKSREPKKTRLREEAAAVDALAQEIKAVLK